MHRYRNIAFEQTITTHVSRQRCRNATIRSLKGVIFSVAGYFFLIDLAVSNMDSSCVFFFRVCYFSTLKQSCFPVWHYTGQIQLPLRRLLWIMVQVNRFRLNFRCHGDILPYLRGIAECLNKAIFQVDSLEVFYQSNYSMKTS